MKHSYNVDCTCARCAKEGAYTTICSVCEYEWLTDTGVQVCAQCGNDGEIEGHVVRREGLGDY